MRAKEAADAAAAEAEAGADVEAETAAEAAAESPRAPGNGRHGKEKEKERKVKDKERNKDKERERDKEKGKEKGKEKEGKRRDRLRRQQEQEAAAGADATADAAGGAAADGLGAFASAGAAAAVAAKAGVDLGGLESDQAVGAVASPPAGPRVTSPGRRAAGATEVSVSPAASASTNTAAVAATAAAAAAAGEGAVLGGRQVSPTARGASVHGARAALVTPPRDRHHAAVEGFGGARAGGPGGKRGRGGDGEHDEAGPGCDAGGGTAEVGLVLLDCQGTVRACCICLPQSVPCAVAHAHMHVGTPNALAIWFHDLQVTRPQGAATAATARRAARRRWGRAGALAGPRRGSA